MEKIDTHHDFANDEASGTNGASSGVKLDAQHDEHLKRYQTASSVVIPREVFETMYLSPYNRTQGHLRSTFGNPTPMPIMGFVIASMALGCNLMGWRGSGGNGAAIIGLAFFFGGMLQIIGSVMEWVLGNTFPFVVFASYGAFWLSMGATLQPSFNAQGYFVDPSTSAAAQAAGQAQFYASFAFFWMCMSILSLFYCIASLRTNIVFFGVFFFIELTFLMLMGSYWTLAEGKADIGHKLQITAGAFVFVFCILAWYLFFALILLSVDFPYSLPVGDLSTRIRSATDRKKDIAEKV